MTTREQVIAAAIEADSGFDGGDSADGTMGDSIVGIDAVERFYAIAFQAGAASRDAEIQRLQMALADAEALELGTAEKCNQLRTELVKALAACKAKDEALRAANHSCIEDWPLLRRNTDY